MDFDDAKENIQPLAAGRNASILHASLSAESHHELQRQRKEHENAIEGYEGDDPLGPWFDYIIWIEQSYPSGGRESGLEEVLVKCLQAFEGNPRYNQDRRLIKLYIKFIDSHENPQECYQELYNQGVGTVVADLYICWAYYYDLCGNFQKADSIFRKGIEARAQPFDELDQAYKHFGFTMSQRILHNDEESQQKFMASMSERRHALTSLRAHRKKVGSIRTGAAVKSHAPGKVQVDRQKPVGPSCNVSVRVFEDENQDPNAIPEIPEPQKSVVRSIIDSARKQENIREPGPWSKANSKRKGPLFDSTASHEPAFEILEDEASASDPKSDQELKELAVKLPPNFVRRNDPQPEWSLAITLENQAPINSIPNYPKGFLYPQPNREFSHEEYLAYRWFKKRSIENKFTRKYDSVWANSPLVGLRMYPNFRTKNVPQDEWNVERFVADPAIVQGKMKVSANLTEVYPTGNTEEFSVEEIMFAKWKRGERKLKFSGDETIAMVEQMDETVCNTSPNRRKSFFPPRKSIAPLNFGGRKSIAPPQMRNAVPKDEETENNEEAKSPELVQGSRRSVIIENPLKTPQKGENPAANLVSPSPRPPFKMQKMGTPRNFNIFDEEQEKETDKAPATEDEGSFKFKTPAIPPPAVAPVKSQQKVAFQIHEDDELATPAAPKVPFQIYEEEEAPAPALKVPFQIYEEDDAPSVQAAPHFDVNETCSTQMFNIFIKAQSVSTPKMQKTVSIFNKPELSHAPLSNASPALAGPVCAQSPPEYAENGKHLSTIMETSEPHTGSTKSSVDTHISSPEFDIEISKVGMGGSKLLDAIQEGVSIMGRSQKIGESEIERIQASKRSILTSVSDEAHGLRMISSKVDSQNESKKSFLTSSELPKDDEIRHDVQNVSKLQSKMSFLGKGSVALSSKEGTETLPQLMTSLKFSESFHTEDVAKANPETPAATRKLAVGNISRFEENPDTVPEMKSVQFFEEKTETMSKFVMSKKLPVITPLARRDVSRLEPKENTMSSISQEQFGEDKTGTIPKITTKKSIQFEEEKPAKKPIHDDDDDMFDFFTQSPPKTNKSSKVVENTKDVKDKSILSASTFFGLDDSPAGPKPNLSFLKGKSNAKPQNLSFLPGFDSPEAWKQKSPVKKMDVDETKSEQKEHEKGPLKACKSNLSFLPGFDDSIAAAPSSVPIPNKKADESKFSIFNDSNVGHEPAKGCLTSAKSNLSFLPFDDSVVAPIPNQKADEPKFSIFNDSNLGHKQEKGSLTSARTNLSFLPGFDDSKVEPKCPSKPKTNISFLSKFNESTAKNGSPNMDLSKSNKTSSEESKQSSPPKPQTRTFSFLSNFDEIKSQSSSKKDDSKQLNNFSLFEQSNPLQKTPLLPTHTASHTVNKSVIFDASLRPDDFFEDNIQTDAFAPNSSMIKNSTWLPNHMVKMEKSLHIIDTSNDLMPPPPAPPAILQQTDENEDDDEFGRSIYFKQTPKTPLVQRHIWDDSHETNDSANDDFCHPNVDLEYTRQVLDERRLDENVNPFDADLIATFLEELDFSNYIEKDVDTCQMVRRVCPLRKGAVLTIKNETIDVLKLIGEGAYGSIYLGKNASGRQFALKQEKPANLWEYYICLELKDRIKNAEVFSGFMNVERALIGNNASVLVSQYSRFGSLIAVCNQVKKITLRNVDEYVVMHLTSQLLLIIDHLHAASIIHADIKADNFLLMNKLAYGSKQPSIQLIDFGVSIDLEVFRPERPNPKFRFVHSAEDFKCVEMRENRPWSYELDLYGLAGVIHVLLFGKYMNIEKKPTGWMHTTKMPRYFHKAIWDPIFHNLLNIKNNQMPNLQDLRSSLEEVMVEKERSVRDKINEFNCAVEQTK